MKKQIFIFVVFTFAVAKLYAQQPLPFVSAANIHNKIIISWVNTYTKPVNTINIQRSFDSLKNFYTIGSVLSPQSRENGYTDDNPPYNKMYYRVFVSFEGGSYIFTPPVRPVKDISDNSIVPEKYPWMLNNVLNDSVVVNITPGKAEPDYPSLRVFTAKDNNIVIHLPEVPEKKYNIKFFDENEKFLFELTKLKEEYLIIEKVNFVHTGWFRFEVYENGVLIEDNKFRIEKDLRDPKKL